MRTIIIITVIAVSFGGYVVIQQLILFKRKRELTCQHFELIDTFYVTMHFIRLVTVRVKTLYEIETSVLFKYNTLKQYKRRC